MGNIKLIRGGSVVSSSGCSRADILIRGEKIAALLSPEEGELSKKEFEAAEMINASGKLIFPGFIDPHTHFDLHVAGTVTIDDFASGTRAAIAGGTTTIIDFGTQYKGETLKEGLDNWKQKAADGVYCDYGIHMSITDWNENVRQECQDMMDEGVPTFKIYMTYDTQVDDKTILEILKRLREVGGITGCHCENSGLIEALRDEAVKNGDIAKVSSHYKTRPAAAEAEAISRLLRLSQIADTPVIDVHLTNEEGLKEIRAARARGQKVYAETCPQYLLMDDSLYEQEGFEGAKYVIAPPLRTKRDNEVLWKAIADGEIQTVATDHCSFTFEQKHLGEDDFRKIPGGMPGVETRGELMYSEGVAKGRIGVEKLCEVLSENPARLYGLYPQKGVIAPGADADIVILDPKANKTLSIERQISKCDYCPFEGREIEGVIEKVFLRGELAAENGRALEKRRGVFLKRGRSKL